MTEPSGLRLDTFHQVAIPTEDLERAIEFYRDVLGAPFIAKYAPPGLAFFDIGGVRLMVTAAEEEGEDEGSSPLYFRVDDIDAAFAELRSRGVSVEHEPHLIFRDDDGTFGEAGAELWMAFFRDPDGNLLAIASEAVKQAH